MLGSGRTTLSVPLSCWADTGRKGKRYFSPTGLSMKPLNALVGLLHGLGEGSVLWNGRKQGTSSDGAGVWSQENSFHRVRSSCVLVAKFSSRSGLLLPRKGKSSHTLFHIENTFPQLPQTCQWIKRKNTTDRRCLRLRPNCLWQTTCPWLTALKHLHAMINGLPQGPAEIKQEYFWLCYLSEYGAEIHRRVWLADMLLHSFKKGFQKTETYLSKVEKREISISGLLKLSLKLLYFPFLVSLKAPGLMECLYFSSRHCQI